MKFESDILFEDCPYMFCSTFDEGFQTFSSWEKFIAIYMIHAHKISKPLYVNSARVDSKTNTIFVDVGEFIQVPWDELSKYI